MAEYGEIDPDVETPSGSGALGGLVAGGVIGAPFGPAGVILGGLMGGLFGNAVEYQNLKEEKQQELQNLAWKSIQDNNRRYIEREKFLGVEEDYDEYGEYWEFSFKATDGEIYSSKFYITDG